MAYSNSDSFYVNDASGSDQSNLYNFDVYVGRNERVGQVIDVLIERNNEAPLLLIALSPDQADTQVLVPLNRVVVHESSHSIFLEGISRSQFLALPDYRSQQVAGSSAIPTFSDFQSGQPEHKQIASDSLNSSHQSPPLIISSTSSQMQSKVVEQHTVQLLEERLRVNLRKRKVGEVIVRKEIETEIVQVPLRRERLIVEQVSPERKQLANFSLSSPEIDGVELTDISSQETASALEGEFHSARAASRFLEAIANHSETDVESIRVIIQVDNIDLKSVYQEWLNRFQETT
ncbi:MAG TPA: DUF2382 domain-containing protein [Leptolyngbyaceae cyanobacterium M33_DOE_097]|uniref:DUF2382 domain-containing protein n=1 Tax=Oscillatoriales cyanobacterium SpSt-418 TaxID=2282169 RepID=A0A7C3PKD6_9CYAN|nr:DUF2382 domain-containing protein [Leptolyngbyaceae cyanobacterium M33_DOE_097]